MVTRVKVPARTLMLVSANAFLLPFVERAAQKAAPVFGLPFCLPASHSIALSRVIHRQIGPAARSITRCREPVHLLQGKLPSSGMGKQLELISSTQRTSLR